MQTNDVMRVEQTALTQRCMMGKRRQPPLTVKYLLGQEMPRLFPVGGAVTSAASRHIPSLFSVTLRFSLIGGRGFIITRTVTAVSGEQFLVSEREIDVELFKKKPKRF